MFGCFSLAFILYRWLRLKMFGLHVLCLLFQRFFSKTAHDTNRRNGNVAVQSFVRGFVFCLLIWFFSFCLSACLSTEVIKSFLGNNVLTLAFVLPLEGYKRLLKGSTYLDEPRDTSQKPILCVVCCVRRCYCQRLRACVGAQVPSGVCWSVCKKTGKVFILKHLNPLDPSAGCSSL